MSIEYRKVNGRYVCPNCVKVGTLMTGPEGGMCVNVQCANCKSEWNATPFGLDPLCLLAEDVVRRGAEYEKPIVTWLDRITGHTKVGEAQPVPPPPTLYKATL